MKNTDKKKVFFICCLFILNMTSLPIIGLGALWPGGGGGGGEPIVSEKIGVFFWAGDSADPVAGERYYETFADMYIDEYINNLIGRGYTKIFEFKDIFESSLDFCFSEIEEYESKEDIIFFYFSGHGRADTLGEYSYVKLNHYVNDYKFELSSSKLKEKLNTLESERIGFLVDACQSGYFVDNFDDKMYLAISSTDYTHDSIGWDISHESYFSNYFWAAITCGDDACEAWANGYMWNYWLEPIPWPLQYPMYDDNLFEQTGYMFFED